MSKDQITYRSLIPSSSWLFDETHVDHALLLDFLLVFSRMEYALKAANYVRKGRSGEPQIKWEKFTEDIQGRLNLTQNAEQDEARKYLQQNPPKRQRYDNVSGPYWESRSQKQGQSEEAFLVESVKTVRNNLFHGGKESGNPLLERDKKLLQAALLVVAAIIDAEPKVRDKFGELGIAQSIT